MSPWSAAALPTGHTLVIAGVFVAGAAALLYALAVFSGSRRPLDVRATLRRAAGTPALGSPRAVFWAQPSRWPMALAAVAGVAMTTVPALHYGPVVGGFGEVVWLAPPLGISLLAACWRLRGALAGLVLSLLVYGLVEGLAPATSHKVADYHPWLIGLAAGALAVANALAVGWIAGLMPEIGSAFEVGAVRRLRPGGTGGDRDSDLRGMLDRSADLLVVVDADGSQRAVGLSACLTLGYDRASLTGASFFDHVHADDSDRVMQTFLACFDRPGAGEPVQFRYRHGDGSWRYLEAVFNNLLADDEIGGVIISSRDVTERKGWEEQITRQAHYDALTGLPNRKLFLDRLNRAVAIEQRQPHSVAVMFIDLDRFKVINDSMGHAAGDALLIAVAERLATCVRPTDTVARLGGDEFTVIMQGVEREQDAMHIARRIVQTMSDPFYLEGTPVFSGASIGVLVSEPPHESPDDLLRKADVALYRAKSLGRGQAVLFRTGMDDEADQRFVLETELQVAVKEGSLILHYQPEIDLATGAVAGMEALVRWPRGSLGLLPPSEFITIAEEAGLIIPLGRWVLETACRELSRWIDESNGSDTRFISINVSAKQLHDAHFVDDVREILINTDVPPGRLCFEITESTLLEENSVALTALQEIRALGVRLAIDDFGAGYSSLSYLTRLPVDTIKVDRSFVALLGTAAPSSAICEAIVVLAHRLGIAVTAEGIESLEHLARVRELGFDHGQGFYLGRPVPSAGVTTAPAGR
ncbi:MAG: EAL domain-containing protein [Dehalococcoidia bacterium]